MNQKLTAYVHEKFPDHMGQGQQTVDAFLVINGWQKQPAQKGEVVWKCPVTGDNYFQAEALRRANDRPFEDRVILILGSLLKKKEDLSKVAREANTQLEAMGKEVEALTNQKTDLEQVNKEMVVKIGQLQDQIAAKPATVTPPAPTPAPAKSPTPPAS